MKNTQTKINEFTVDSDSFREQFTDEGTRVTDDHLTEACEDDLQFFTAALWGLSHISKGTTLPHKDIENLSYCFGDIRAKLEKALDFARLAQYATGFQIPEGREFKHIDIEALKKS